MLLVSPYLEKIVLAVSWLTSCSLTFSLPFPDFWPRREATAMAPFHAPGTLYLTHPVLPTSVLFLSNLPFQPGFLLQV